MTATLTAARRRSLLAAAEELARGLWQSGVTRSEWSHLIHALYRPTPGSTPSLTAAEQLLEKLPTCGLERRDRKGRARRSLELLRETFDELQARPWNEAERRFVVGWTARRLSMIEKAKGP